MTSTDEVHVDFYIDPTSRQPIYRQLAMQIREATARGKLHPGDKLPSVREMSKSLVINPNTVARVYLELEREGVLNTRPGLGVFVARPQRDLTKRVRRERLSQQVDQLLTEAVHLGFSSDEVQLLVAERLEQFQWSQVAVQG